MRSGGVTIKLETVKTFTLFILIGVSLLLTFGLWTYQPNYETLDISSHINEADIGGSREETKATIVEPSSIIIHTNDHHFGFTDPSDRQAFYQDMQSWSFTNLEVRESNARSQNNYEVEIIFPSALPVELLNDLFTLSDDDAEILPTWSFDRMYLTFDDLTSSINVEIPSIDENEQATAVINDSDRYEQLWDTVTVREGLTEYVHFDEGESPIYIPQEGVSMQQYSLAADVINPNDMVNALFPDPSLVSQSNESVASTEEVYYSDAQRGMSIYEERGTMEYINPQSSTPNDEVPIDLLERSISQINDHNGWTEEYKLMDLETAATNRVLYRKYHNGYPVFNFLGLSKIEQEWNDQELAQYHRPIFNLNNTLSSQSHELPSGNDVLYYINNKFRTDYDVENIQDVKPGYRLVYNGDYVALEPGWYLKYNDNWREINVTDIGPDEGGG
ncbi:YycH family regulatory protein [Virgibacillus natechei]|uniref:YycH family regulatory protein n=1 Tax=Virgibacillus natechei TaxID=1216297 RepID=UPI0022321DFB|nr:YycH family regulatory protein [Virgibacillus natechei]UZD12966.1 YycH family regulatory protein [Virgibacillus natechei]